MGHPCESAYKRYGDDTMRCKRMEYPDDCCAHVKFCRVTGHWENSDGYTACPLRNKSDLKGEKENG